MRIKLLNPRIVFLIVLISAPIFAQEITGKVGNTYRIKLNKINLPISNNGILADVSISPEGYLGKFNEVPFLFSGGFLIGGYKSFGPWVCGESTSILLHNFIPGKINDPNNSNNQIYVLKSSDKPFSKSWIDWIDAVKLGALYYDGDKNSRYEPIDKNDNKAWDLDEDMPDLLGDITVWCVFNDGVPENQRTRFVGVNPQGLEIKQTIFGSTSLQYLKNILFIRYSITNRGTVDDILDSVYFSPYTDPDLGWEFQDDKAGYDDYFNANYAYQDTLDIYDNFPPFLFISLVQGPVFYTGDYNDQSNIKFGELIGDSIKFGCKNIKVSSSINFFSGLWDWLFLENYYNLMAGYDIQGQLINPCDFQEYSTFVNVSCDSINPRYLFAGDPFKPEGWLMKVKMDQRILLNIGPFKLEKDKPQDIIIAYSLGWSEKSFSEAFYNGKTSVGIAKSEWEENFPGLSYINVTQSPEPKVWQYYHLSQNYPNPFNPTTKIVYEIPRSEFVKLKVYNSLGQEVRTLVNHEQKTGRYEFEFDGTNLSSGIYFYRIDAGGFFETRKMTLLR